MSRCRRDPSLVLRSVEGDLTPAEALRLARHVEACTACRIVLAREARLARMLDELHDPVEVDETFFQAVMASLPDRPALPSAEAAARARRRRGLKLAGLTSLTALAFGLASRIAPTVRLDLAAPSMPRFSPEETSVWLSFLGSAARWVSMTAQSLAWTGSTEALGPRTLGVLGLEAAMMGAAVLLAVSGALALASRVGSRAS